jgi:type II secretory ATPase GspE/PulE/Tfp pilus assembly ATPase PilB-like protein
MEEVVHLMIALGKTLGATEIHLTSHVDPDSGEGVTSLRYTVHGALAEHGRIDRRLMPAIAEEWKRMASCSVDERRRPQEGRLQVSGAEMRVFFTPATVGEMITVRILDPQEVHLGLDHLGFALRDHERLLRAIRSPAGVVIVTGPTGSGKTTTIYSCLQEIAGPERKIVTVEDPVEIQIPWVTQVAVDDSAGVTHLSAVRSLLRSAPDVLFVSEIRDGETASVVQHAALTGHMVFTALHTGTAAQALVRLVEAGVDPFIVGDATRLVVAQRLIRELCLECKGAGCKECRSTGFVGRTVMAEVLEVSSRVKEALREGASAEEIEGIAVEEGMTTLGEDGRRRVEAGETTPEEIRRVL